MKRMDATRLIAYDYWANQESLQSVCNADSHAPAVAVLAHVVAIGNLWLARAIGGAFPPAWPDWNIETVRRAMDSAFAGWNKTLEEVASGARPHGLEYENTVGQRCCNSFFEVVIE